MKKATRDVRDQIIDNTEAVEYAFWGEKPSWMIEDQEEEECIEADILQDAMSITEKLYGPEPAAEAYRVKDDYWKAHVRVIGREKLEIDPVYQRLDQEYKTTQISASQREWEKKCKEVEIGLMAGKHGYSPEEIKRRQDEEAFDSAVCENCKIFAKNDIVLFKLWGYMQIYWLKLPETWHE